MCLQKSIHQKHNCHYWLYFIYFLLEHLQEIVHVGILTSEINISCSTSTCGQTPRLQILPTPLDSVEYVANSSTLNTGSWTLKLRSIMYNVDYMHIGLICSSSIREWSMPSDHPHPLPFEQAGLSQETVRGKGWDD